MTRNVEYRVLRPDETLHNGIPFAPGVNRAYSRDGNALGFFKDLNAHIRDGTRASPKKPFITATESVQAALWWSGFGLLKIACIKLDTLRDAGVAQWHVGAEHSELCYTMARCFASASCEIVFSSELPFSAVEEYPIKWEVISRLCDSDNPIGTFPNTKSLSTKNFKFVEALKGSTEPMKVEVTWKEKKREYTKEFVFKRGGKEEEDAHSRNHAKYEYLASLMYGRMGVRVPLMALYHVKVTGGREDMLGSFYFTLIEYVNDARTPHPMTDNDFCARKLVLGYVADVALANFDVVGDNMENLLIKDNELIRIDFGGSLQFQPTGKLKKDGFTVAAIIRDINLFLHDKSKCSANELRVDLFKRVDKNEPATVAMVKAQLINILFERDFLQAMRMELSVESAPPEWFDDLHIIVKRLKIFADSFNCATTAEVSIFDSNLGTHAVTSAAGPAAAPAAAASATSSVVEHDNSANSMVIDASFSGPSSSPSPASRLLPPGTCSSPPGRTSIDSLPKDAEIEVHGRRAWYKGAAGSPKKKVPSECELIDVTSYYRNEWRQLSPMYPHSWIAVPFLSNTYAASVEGVWQGLKMALNPKEGISFQTFQNKTGTAKGMKRFSRNAAHKGVCHYGGGGRADCCGPINPSSPSTQSSCYGLDGQHLGYVEAREKIYIPVYEQMLRKVPHLIEKLQQKLLEGKKLILLDIFTNGNVQDTKTPLSHAQLLRNFVLTGHVLGSEKSVRPSLKRKRKA